MLPRDTTALVLLASSVAARWGASGIQSKTTSEASPGCCAAPCARSLCHALASYAMSGRHKLNKRLKGRDIADASMETQHSKLGTEHFATSFFVNRPGVDAALADDRGYLGKCMCTHGTRKMHISSCCVGHGYYCFLRLVIASHSQNEVTAKPLLRRPCNISASCQLSTARAILRGP